MRIAMNDLQLKVGKIESDVDILSGRVFKCENDQESVNAKIAELEHKLKDQEASHADLQDRSMRNSLSVHKLQKTKPSETWDETAQVLADFLSSKLPGDWMERIERAHRGKTEVIHVQFANWRFAQEVRELFRTNKYRLGEVYYLDKYSDHTLARRRLATEARKVCMAQVQGTKAYIRYPATLAAKRPGEQRYTVIKQF